MKFLLTTAFLFTANAGIAFAEGRYQTIVGSRDGVYMTDTKTGKLRWCIRVGTYPNYEIVCSEWSDKK